MRTAARLRRFAATLLAAFTAFAVAAETAPKPAASVASAPEYTLQAGDTIAISILGQDELSKQMSQLKVSPEFTIRIPYNDEPMNVRGKTREQVAAMVTGFYQPDYLKKPQVTVQIVAHVPRKVRVLGSVGSAREVPFPPEGLKLTLVDALTQAGGFQRIGNMKNVRLKRQLPDGTIETRSINVNNILNKENSKGDVDIELMPDDTIYVDEI